MAMDMDTVTATGMVMGINIMATGKIKNNDKILLTGVAGFIGYHLVQRLIDKGYEVVGIDNLNSYYDVELKYARLERLGISIAENENIEDIHSDKFPGLRFRKLDLCNKDKLTELFQQENFDYVINLAAQAGVRYSLQNPEAYIKSNIEGFLNLLEYIRHNPVKHFIYASSSSVYGDNTKTPFAESDMTDSPVSLYAATKKSNELMARSYSKLYGIASTGLRFFTVYGELGRPDMAPMLFADAILHNKPIRVFNNGDMMRDFTYVGDVVEGITLVIESAPIGDVPAEVYNIGHGSPVKLLDFIQNLEDVLHKKATMEFLPMQPGDVAQTWADTTKFEQRFKYKPTTTLKEGLSRMFAPEYLDKLFK
jgi:UDP-glucuronate 4-epimerase